MRKLKTKNLRLITKSGQALLELAVFGSLVLLLLGTLIVYGLRYDFQQQAQMEVFRKALEMSYQLDSDNQVVGSASYTLVKDRHIPDPSNPFGVGQVTPVIASASVSRDYRMDATPDDYEGLPKMTVQFQGRVDGQLQELEPVVKATAGLRYQSLTVPGNEDDYIELQQKYTLIFGSIGGWCEYETEDEFEEDCEGESISITIVDSVEGEVVDYNGAIRQARLIVDQDFCVQECNRGKKPGGDKNCSSICSSYGIGLPWYIEGAQQNGGNPYPPLSYPGSTAGYNQEGDTWSFPKIEELFLFPGKGKVQALGIQPD